MEVHPRVAHEPPGPQCSPPQASHIPQVAQPVAASPGRGSPQGKAEGLGCRVGSARLQVLSGTRSGLGHRGGSEVPSAIPHHRPGRPGSYEKLATSETRSLVSAGLPLACLRGSDQTRAHVPSAEVAAADRLPHPPCRCPQSLPPPHSTTHDSHACLLGPSVTPGQL